jgi:lipoyl(octanoyl) transferase
VTLAQLLRPEGFVPYTAAYDWMHELAEQRAAGAVLDTLILLEHPPTYTAGRRSDPTHLVWTRAQMESLGAELHEVDRGGSVTFHGPGQLVGYPIIDLGRKPDVIKHLRMIEEVVIRACRDIGVELGRDLERTGVWAGDRKVCAIGVKLTHARVTMHGFALNCDVDLQWFDAIVPCGLADRGVGTLTQLAGRPITVNDMTPLVTKHFGDVFEVQLAEPPEVEALVSAKQAR